jgi:hypothetical protein
MEVAVGLAVAEDVGVAEGGTMVMAAVGCGVRVAWGGSAGEGLSVAGSAGLPALHAHNASGSIVVKIVAKKDSRLPRYT